MVPVSSIGSLETDNMANWVEGDTLHFASGDCTSDLASQLLATSSVRSVVVDHKRDETTVHLCLQEKTDRELLLEEISRLVSRQQQAITDTARRIEAPSEIICWPDETNAVDSYFRAPKMATGWKRLLYLAGAGITFGLAILGALLPGLPTTPFLLLTSYCLLRSSRRLHEKLLQSRVFGGLLRDWHTHRGVRPGVKTKSLAIMALVVGATVVLSGLPARALIGIVACSMIGVVCICRLRVIR